MKSFQAKMYIEDGMATIDFDIQIPKINSVPTEEDAGDKFDIKRKREMISNNDLHFFDSYDDEEKYRNNMNK